MFTTVDNKNHTTANFELLPFVVALLGEGPIPRHGRPLPIGEPAALTHQTVVAIEDICRQAIPAFLCRSGWEERVFFDPRGQRRSGRIWETLRGMEPLRYSHASLETLLAVYNLTRQRSPGQPAVEPIPVPPRDDSQQIGDQLVYHIAILRLSESRPQFEEGLANYLGRSSLNVLARFDLYDEIPDVTELIEEPFVRWLPWLGHRWAKLWLRHSPTRWAGGHQRFQEFNARQQRTFLAWIDQAQSIERPDLLSPLLFFYAELTRRESSMWPARFQDFTHNARLSTRQQLGQSLSDSLQPAQRLSEIYNETRGVHPVEREPAQQVFMEIFTRYNFEQVVDTIVNQQAELIPKIG